MLTAQIEYLDKIALDELIPFFEPHYKELSDHYKHDIPLKPNYHEYLHRQYKDELVYVSLRDSGELIGYFIIFVIEDLHYQALTFQGDIIFVEQSKRGASGGGMLMEVAKKEFVRRGAKVFRVGYKASHAPHMDKLLSAFGFETTEIMQSLWA